MHKPIGILLVEDNDDDVVLIREAFAVEPALRIDGVSADGEQALHYLHRQGKFADVAVMPDLILMDINMPRMNGFEALSAIKHDPELSRIPVIMLTSSDREEDVIRSYSFGASSYIRKPVTLTEMIRVISLFFNYWGHTVILPPTLRR
ncbi:MAG: response regulator [Anaerolinea sp.]|nr:response regulator [Anaerolinea sp.]